MAAGAAALDVLVVGAALDPDEAAVVDELDDDVVEAGAFWEHAAIPNAAKETPTPRRPRRFNFPSTMSQSSVHTHASAQTKLTTHCRGSTRLPKAYPRGGHSIASGCRRVQTCPYWTRGIF